MMMLRSLVVVTALCSCGTAASALTKQECRAKYKAAQATRSVGIAWVDYQNKYCGINAKATARTSPSPLPLLEWSPYLCRTRVGVRKPTWQPASGGRY